MANLKSKISHKLPLCFTFAGLFVNRLVSMIRYKSNGGGKIYEGKSLNPAIETALRDNVDTTLLADPYAKK